MHKNMPKINGSPLKSNPLLNYFLATSL